MKLYFYFLDTRKDNCIRMEECEVEEKEKTYRPINKFPCGYYGCYVRKSDIGRLTGLYQNIIILTEEKPERAAEAFICVCHDDISAAERRIKANESDIKESIYTIEKIEKWRSENAGK